MNARAAIKMNGVSRMERASAAHMLRAMVADWSALMRRFRDAASEATATGEALPRRRRDRHPDAPPRQPLFASRDLPPPDVARRRAATLSVAAEPIAPPRAPEPMSEAQIAQLMATATARPVPIPVVPGQLIRPCPSAGTLEAYEPWPARSLPCVATGDLAMLADRFEGAAARHADVALVPPPVSPMPEATQGRPMEMDAMAAEVALAKALITLRKLAEQRRPARLR